MQWFPNDFVDKGWTSVNIHSHWCSVLFFWQMVFFILVYLIHRNEFRDLILFWKKVFFFKNIVLYTTVEHITSKWIRYNTIHNNQQTPKLVKTVYLLTQVNCHLLWNIRISKRKEKYVQTNQITWKNYKFP